MHLTVPPEEVLVPPGRDEDYVAWRAQTDLRAPYRVAPEFLNGTKKDAAYDLDDCPLIVFINARSGGRVGPELANVLARALGRSQVFDLAHHRPDTVLGQIWRNFDEQEKLGNTRAALVRQQLRILACGGDGTVAWIMKVIHQMDLKPQPPVAILPLGTGNDLSRSFNWGAEFEGNWIKGHASIYATLKRVADARVIDLDCWRLRLTLPDSSYKPNKTYALTELTPKQKMALQQDQKQLAAPPAAAGGGVVLEGMFWNYFSVGADAQAAYNFHHLRDNHPALASNRVANQFWYSAFSCTSGWFCGTLQSVSSFTSIEVQQPGSGGVWSTLVLPPSIQAFVLVNLQSYGGGRNIWGKSESKKKKWRKPNVSDGLIEVVGFTHGFHAMTVMGSGAKLAHGKRLAQVSGIRMALRQPIAAADGGPGEVFMQLDGEPWSQKVPAGSMSGGDLVLEIVHAGVSKVLNNKAESLSHPVRKMTRMLTNQQAEAYLAAPKDTSNTVYGKHPLDQHIELQEPGSSSSSRTSNSSVEAGDLYSGAAARSDPDLIPSQRATPASWAPTGFPSNSGSVSDPGCVPSLSGSGAVGGLPHGGAPEGFTPDLVNQHVRNAISNPGDGSEIVSSDEGHDSGSLVARMQALGIAGGKGEHPDAPAVVALIGPLHNLLDNRALKAK